MVHAPDASKANSRRNIQAAFVSIGILILIGAVATPFATLPLMPLPGFMVAFGAAMIVINALLAAILFSRGAVERRADATALGSAYLFVALIFIPLIATFPDGLVPGTLVGASGSAIWLWVFWHAGYVVSILHYADVTQGKARLPSALLSVGVVAALAAGLGLLCTMFVDLLPPMIQSGGHLFPGATAIAPLSVLALCIYGVFRIATMSRHPLEQLPLTAAMVASCIDIWLTFHGGDRFSLGWYLAEGCSVFSSLVVLVSLLHQMNFIYSRTATANAVLEDMARQDSMTGLKNRRGLDEAIAVAWAESRIDQRPLSLIMIDVDHFKRFNDRYGHPAGDDCLRQVAGALLAVTRRPGDSAARYGGEEFAVLLPLTDAYGAVALARRLRIAIRALAIPHDGGNTGILSVSIGVATVAASEVSNSDALLAAADRALYRAKSDGRDTICAADDLALPFSPLGEAAIPIMAATAHPASATLPRLAGQPPAVSDLQCKVLEAIASGQSFSQAAEVLCAGIEQLVLGIGCIVESGGNTMIRIASAGLPNDFLEAMNAFGKGHCLGSSAAAFESGGSVELHDIATDRFWVSATAVPMKAGLQASWSSVFKNKVGKITGVLTLFYRTPRAPDPIERDIVDVGLYLLSLAMESEAVWTRLRADSQRFGGALNTISQGLCVMSDDILVVANARYSEIYGLPNGALLPGMTAGMIQALRVEAGSGFRGGAGGMGPPAHTAGMVKTIVELQSGRVIAIHERCLANAEIMSTHEDVTGSQLPATSAHAARHDALTGFPNRIPFEERLQQAIALAARGRHCAALSLDIDIFRSINDKYGRVTGDRLLQGVANRLDACVREVDTVAHLGSDAFGIVLVGLEQPEGAAELAKRIARMMLKPFELGGASILATLSIGIAVAPDNGSAPGKLLECANAARSRSKRSTRGTYQYFDPDIDVRQQLHAD